MYLGVVDFKGPGFARVIPLAVVDQGGLTPAHHTDFPTQGKVYWPSAREAVQHALILFGTEDNHGQRDEYKVTNPEPALEVIDLRYMGGLEAARIGLQEGLAQADLAQRRVLVWCEGDEVVGPLKLVARPDGRVTFDDPHPYRIPVHAVAGLNIQAVPHLRELRYVALSASLGSPKGYVDWDEDRSAIKRAINWAVERAGAEGRDLGLTKRLIDEAVQALARLPTTADTRLERYRVERAFARLSSAREADELVSLATEELARLPAVAKSLEQVRVEARQTATDAANSDLQEVRKEALAARQERDALQAQVHEEQVRLEAVRVEFAKQVQSIEEELASRVRAALERPASLLAEAAVLRAVLPPVTRAATSGAQPPLADDYLPARSPLTWTAAPVLNQLSELRSALIASFKAKGLSPVAGLRIHAALSARLLPMVTGPHGMRALESYARVTCGGRVLRIHATPALLEPAELLGRLDPAGVHLLPHSAGLLATIREASQHRRPALVVIEGANRGATEAYLLPLLQGLMSGLPLQLPAARNGEAEVLRWPESLLLAATLVEGPTALPVSRDLWACAVAVEAAVAPASSSEPASTELAPGTALLRPAAISAGDIVQGLLEHVPECEPLRPALERFAAGVAVFESGSAGQGTALLECCALPFIASLEDEAEREAALAQALQGLAAEERHDQLRQLARRIRRRVG